MDKTLKREELATLLRSLSAADMAWLRQRLLRRDSAALLQDQPAGTAERGILALGAGRGSARTA